MLYVPYPSWSDDDRLEHLPVIDTSGITITPAEAIARSGAASLPDVFRLEMFGREPVYRIVSGGRHSVISAQSGQTLTRFEPGHAASHVAAAFPGRTPTLADTLHSDQWTVTSRYNAHRPLYRYSLNDDADTSIYVSSATGEIVQDTTFAERAWNWAGAIPHWIYFASLRKHREAWRQAVMWLSGPLVIGAITGLWIGILRLRISQNTKRARGVSPYRGWMRWHHIGGLIGGLFLTTWIFSGWLSVNPFHWFARTQITQEQRIAFSGWNSANPHGATLAGLKAIEGAKEVSMHWAAGRSLLIVRSPDGARLLDARTGKPTSLNSAILVEAAARMYPDHQISGVLMHTSQTLYWYSHHTKRALPIMDVRFDDPAATRIYVDPKTATLAGLSDRSARGYRWLFSFLHDYDLPVLLENRPARDVLIWLLSLAGIIISVSGIVIGWRTLKRTAARSPEAPTSLRAHLTGPASDFSPAADHERPPR